jgi:hypothetical protein
MVNDATVSARWIGKRFINAADVTVEQTVIYFMGIEGWKKDPCLGV